MKETTDNWIKKAEEDYKSVQILLKDEAYSPSIVCFHCQQTAEKYLKAYLSEIESDFPRTHDLLNLLENYIVPKTAGFNVLQEDLVILTDYAVESRYPDFLFSPTKENALEALKSTEKVRHFIREKLHLQL